MACTASPSCCCRRWWGSTRRSRRLLFGAAEDDDGDPLYDVVVCGLTPRPGRRRPTASAMVPAAGPEALATADTVVVPGTRYPPARDDGVLDADVARPRCDRSGPAPGWCPSAPARSCWPRRACSTGGRATTHWKFADDLRSAASRRSHVDENVLFVDDGDVLTSAGSGGGNRPVPARHSLRPRRAGRQRGGAVLRRAAVAGGRPGAVHRPARARRRIDASTAATRAWALRAPRRGTDRRAAGPARAHEPAHVQPPLPRGDRSGAGQRGSGTGASTAPANCWSRATCPSTRWPGSSGLGTGGNLRHHLRRGRRDVAVELSQGVPGRLSVAG